jgi:flagellar hook-associated protein 1 FlgK
LKGFDSLTSDSVVADPNADLNSDGADLNFKPTNGSFVVHVKDKTTGSVTSTLVQVNLDGTGVQTSLNSLTADLDGIPDISASVTGGKLTVKADSTAVEISFSQDSSGTLAALGIGNFFNGSDGRDIAVNTALVKDPRLLAASKNGQPADNQTAKAISALQTQAIGSLDGQSLVDAYQAQVNGVAAKVAGAKQDADSAQVVRDTLQSQRDSVSGVSLDDEAISLMKYQRAFQASSRVIAATDEMMQTLLQLV